MKEKNIKKKSGTDCEKLSKMEDNEIDYSDTPELDESFSDTATIRIPEPKKAVTARCK